MGPQRIESIVLATSNLHKVAEFKSLSGGHFKTLSLLDVQFTHKLPPEDAESYEGNAQIKARFVGNLLNTWVLADDSGFEVEALESKPGIHSARFMGTSDSKIQCDEILRRMQNQSHRAARFVCALSLYQPDRKIVHSFRGECRGVLLESPMGDGGFGYDPIFCPENSTKSFSQMSFEEKNQISHRARAMQSLIAWWCAL